MTLQQDTQIWRRGIFIACLLLAACDVTPTSDVPAVPTCISPATEANPYYSPLDSDVDQIYQQYTNGSLPLQQAQLRAFSYLQQSVQRWSDHADIVVKDRTGVRITITYISPELLHLIVLNQVLHNNPSLNNFQQELKIKMDKLANRNETIFFVLVAASTNANQLDNSQQLLIHIPIQDMTLTNASDLSAHRTHDDHVLDEVIPITREAISGYVAFPLSVIQNDQCILMMDSRYDTTITLDVPYLTINDRQFSRQFWSIPYNSLVAPSIPDSTPIPLDPNFDPARDEPLRTPPSPVWDDSVTNQQGYWSTYWQDVGRYLWHRIMLEDYP